MFTHELTFWCASVFILSKSYTIFRIFGQNPAQIQYFPYTHHVSEK